MKMVGLILALLVLGLVAPSIYNAINIDGSIVEEAIPSVTIKDAMLKYTVRFTGDMFLLSESHYVSGYVEVYNSGVEPVKIVNISLIYTVDFGGKCKVLIEPLLNP